jgi:hypothetical protein
MNSGKYVFSQVLDFVNKYEFDKCVKRYGGNHRVRGLKLLESVCTIVFRATDLVKFVTRHLFVFESP